MTKLAGDKQQEDNPKGKGARRPRALLFALAHPTRVGFAKRAAERQISPKEFADEVGSSASHVSYHARVLQECGLVELVDTAQRRGAIEHFYRADTSALLEGPLRDCIPEDVRRNLSDEELAQMVMRIASLDPPTDFAA